MDRNGFPDRGYTLFCYREEVGAMTHSISGGGETFYILSHKKSPFRSLGAQGA